MIKNKLDLFPYRIRPAADIFFNCLFKNLKSCPCIVKAFDSLIESIRRIFRKLSLEIAKGSGALVEVLRLFHPVVACGICNKFVGSPILSF